MDPKDQAISKLRAEIYQLKQAEAGHRALDERISQLQTQYALAFDEKERFDKEQKHQVNEDSSTILELKREIDLLKGDIERVGLQNDEKANEIVKLKKMAEARATDIQLNKKDCITLQNRNRNLFEGNKEIVLAIRNSKQERMAIEADIEALEEGLANKLQAIRAKEKEIRDKDVQLFRMRKHLDSLNAEIARLECQISENQEIKNMRLEEIQKKSREKEQFLNTLQSLEAELQHWNQECFMNQKAYDDQATSIKALSKKKALLEAAMRQKEIAIDDLKEQKAKQCEIKGCLVQDNLTLNSESQKNMKLVRQLTSVNEQLQREIAAYSEQDEAARKILDRKAKLREALKMNNAELKRTFGGVEHILQDI